MTNTSKSPNKQPSYKRFVNYGLGHKELRSKEFERRDKKSFRKWMRRKLKGEK